MTEEQLFNPKLKAIVTALILALCCVASWAEQTAGGSHETVYKQVCAKCHSGGVKGWLSGAPKTGKKKAWTEHLKKGKEQMTKNVLEGSKKHKAFGTYKDFTKKEVVATIDFMLKQVEPEEE